MDPTELRNYISNYEANLFYEGNDENLEPIECLVQSYTSSLKLMNSTDSLELLDYKLKKYSNQDNQCKPNCTSIKGAGFRSNLGSVSIKSLINPLPCSTNGSIYCEHSENPTGDIHEFVSILNKTGGKQNITYYNNKRKCTGKVPEVNVFSDNGNQMFRTAREELSVQNVKKCGVNSRDSNNGSQKKKIATRKGKFISPLLSNIEREEMNTQYEDNLQTAVEEHMKNVEPKMIELICSEIMDRSPKVAWNDIAGLEFAKTAIQESVVWPLLRPDIFTGLRRPPKAILLFGPPGTGKTLLGKCVASQGHSTFFSISASSLTSKWIGDGEKMVRALFAVSRCHQPAVIFIDEIDSLLSQRSDTEHESSRRIKTQFLIELDGATTDSDEKILVIAGTNRPQELDEAARRRFVKRLYIPLPDLQARFQLIKKLMVKEKHDLDDQEIQEVASLTDGYSGADIRNLCSEASLGPIRSIDISLIEKIQVAEVRPVGMEDFKSALIRVKSSVSAKDLEHYVTWNNTYGSDNFL